MNGKTELIVLNTTKVGEKGLVVHALTPVWGRRSFITSVPRGGSKALLMPMSIIEAELCENPRSELWRMKAISTSCPLSGIRTRIAKNSMTMFLAEVLYRTVKDSQGDEQLYDWCKKAILTLDALEQDFSNVHLRFLMELCCVLGFRPGEEDIRPFCHERLRETTELLKCSFADFLLYPLSGESRGEIAENLLRYLSYHTESQINVRSLRVLHELFV